MWKLYLDVMLVCTNLAGQSGDVLFPSSVERPDEVPVAQSVEITNEADGLRILGVLATGSLQNVAFRAYRHDHRGHYGAPGSCSRALLTNAPGRLTTNLAWYVAIRESEALEHPGDLPRVACFRLGNMEPVGTLTNGVLPLLFRGTNGKPRQVQVTMKTNVAVAVEL